MFYIYESKILCICPSVDIVVFWAKYMVAKSGKYLVAKATLINQTMIIRWDTTTRSYYNKMFHKQCKFVHGVLF